jgi:hypothetical protein
MILFSFINDEIIFIDLTLLTPFGKILKIESKGEKMKDNVRFMRFSFAPGVLLATALLLGCSAGIGAFKPMGESPKLLGVPKQVKAHYFFDRTASMRGFTAKGDDAAFVNAIPSIWRSVEDAFSNVPQKEEHFYEYGETDTHEFSGATAQNTVKKELLQSTFYGGIPKGAGGIRAKIKDNGGQPITAVTDYVNDLSAQPENAGSLYVVVTDFYEQNREDPFTRFYREAFLRGDSAAIFAIESPYDGTIYSVSMVEEKPIRVKDGISTFFLCIQGDSALVSPYCAALAKELKKNSIKFNYSCFMMKAGDRTTPKVQKPVPASRLEFAQSSNAANFDINSVKPPVYRLIRDNSRYVASLNFSNLSDDFTFAPQYSIYSFNAQSDRWQEATASINIKLQPNKARTALNFFAETDNRELKKGYYKIDYKIVGTAKTSPQWVKNLNAADIHALEDSVSAGKDEQIRVKVLQFANKYEKIAEAYNKIDSRSMYQGEVYLVKK